MTALSASHCEGNEGSIRELFQAVFIIEHISQSYISISNITSSQVFHCHCFEEYIKMLSPSFLSVGREEQRIRPIVTKVMYRSVSYLLQRYMNFLPCPIAAYMRKWSRGLGVSRSRPGDLCSSLAGALFTSSAASCQEPLFWSLGQ